MQMYSIRVDEQVLEYIESKAKAAGLSMFRTTENDALREIFNLGAAERNAPAKKSRKRSASGSVLLRAHQGKRDMKGVNKAFYQLAGVSFSKPKEYPVAFFDADGYIVIKSEEELENPAFSVTTGVYVAGGISSLTNYKKCGHLHTR